VKRLWRLAVSQSEVDARLIAKGLQAALCLPVIPLNARGHERNPSRYGSAGCPTPHPGAEGTPASCKSVVAVLRRL
jgi:hypothetical protein